MTSVAPIRNVWSKNGLDLTNTAFSKVYHQEVTFSEKDDSGDTLKKFDLEPERFEELRTLLIRKQNRMALKKLLQVTEGGINLDLLDQPQLITKPTMITHRDTVWRDVDLHNESQEDVNEVYDNQLKCHAFGSWILDCLTNRAIQKLKFSKTEWSIEQDGETYLHGPILFWHIVDAVKPNNDTLIQHTKEKLASLDVKNFEYSVKEMLTEFENLCTEVEVRLKGHITEDEKISALWKALESMKDEHFSRIVSDEKRAYRRQPKANRKKNSELIELFKREQTDLEADGKWNRPNKDQQILALTSILQSVITQVNNVHRDQTGSTNDSGSSGSDPSKKRRKNIIPAWKWERKDDETSREVGGKTYYWCEHHTNLETGSQGMWTLHKQEDHKGPMKKSNAPTTTDATTTPAADQESESAPVVQVDKNLFNSLKSGAEVQSYLDAVLTNGTTLN